MLEKCKDAQERWGGVHQLIDKWLSDRQKLIVLYCNLSATKPLSDEEPLGVMVQLSASPSRGQGWIIPYI